MRFFLLLLAAAIIAGCTGTPPPVQMYPATPDITYNQQYPYAYPNQYPYMPYQYAPYQYPQYQYPAYAGVPAQSPMYTVTPGAYVTPQQPVYTDIITPQALPAQTGPQSPPYSYGNISSAVGNIRER